MHEAGDFEGINPVILCLTAVYSFHIQSMSEYKVDAQLFTEVRDPLPAMHALNPDNNVSK